MTVMKGDGYRMHADPDTAEMKFYPYALFDMDGTMTDSMPYWENVGAEYIRSKGMEPKPGLWETLSTRPYPEAALFVKEDYGIMDAPENFASEINRLMKLHYQYDIPLKPGVREYLKYLHENGIKLGVCSATAVHLVEMTLSRLDVLQYFDSITSCEEAGGMSKTEPDVFLLAMKRLGAEPEETVMYEDAPFGIKTAKKTGMIVCRVFDHSYQDAFDEAKKYYDCFVKDFSAVSFCPQERRHA